MEPVYGESCVVKIAVAVDAFPALGGHDTVRLVNDIRHRYRKAHNGRVRKVEARWMGSITLLDFQMDLLLLENMTGKTNWQLTPADVTHALRAELAQIDKAWRQAGVDDPLAKDLGTLASLPVEALWVEGLPSQGPGTVITIRLSFEDREKQFSAHNGFERRIKDLAEAAGARLLAWEAKDQ